MSAGRIPKGSYVVHFGNKMSGWNHLESLGIRTRGGAVPNR
jgi:hypothetical protein